MSLIRIYFRALGLLWTEKRLLVALIAANIAIAFVQVAEQRLFGLVVDAIANKGNTLDLIGIWAGLGLFGILASVIVAVAADRMAHRQRLGAMRRAFERSITLPISYHAERGSGAVVRDDPGRHGCAVRLVARIAARAGRRPLPASSCWCRRPSP